MFTWLAVRDRVYVLLVGQKVAGMKEDVISNKRISVLSAPMSSRYCIMRSFQDFKAGDADFPGPDRG